MSTATFVSKRGQYDNATSQQWVGGLLNALIAIGMVQTGDAMANLVTPSNVDSTVTLAGMQSTGYDAVFRFDDALQSTAPLFLHFHFAAASTNYGGGTNDPAMSITIGKGSDGAGNVTDVLYTAGNIRSSQVNNNFTSFLSSGDGSMLCMALFQHSGNEGEANGNWLFFLDRSRDSSNGSATGTGIYINHRGSGQSDNGQSQVSYGIAYTSGATVGVGVGITPILYILNTSTISLNRAGVVPVFKGQIVDGDGNIWTAACHVVYAYADMGFCQINQVDGGNTFLALGAANNANGYADLSHQAYASYAMAYY